MTSENHRAFVKLAPYISSKIRSEICTAQIAFSNLKLGRKVKVDFALETRFRHSGRYGNVHAVAGWNSGEYVRGCDIVQGKPARGAYSFDQGCLLQVVHVVVVCLPQDTNRNEAGVPYQWLVGIDHPHKLNLDRIRGVDGVLVEICDNQKPIVNFSFNVTSQTASNEYVHLFAEPLVESVWELDLDGHGAQDVVRGQETDHVVRCLCLVYRIKVEFSHPDQRRLRSQINLSL